MTMITKPMTDPAGRRQFLVCEAAAGIAGLDLFKLLVQPGAAFIKCVVGKRGSYAAEVAVELDELVGSDNEIIERLALKLKESCCAADGGGAAEVSANYWPHRRNEHEGEQVLMKIPRPEDLNSIETAVWAAVFVRSLEHKEDREEDVQRAIDNANAIVDVIRRDKHKQA